MAENPILDKKNLTSTGKRKDNVVKKKDRKKIKKLKQLRKKRLIVRNLSFKVSEDELKQVFSKFGEVLDVKIPVNEAGKKRGFAFVQFKDTTAQIKAMKQLNFKKIDDRPIAIDFAVDKTTYQSRRNSFKSSDSKKVNTLNETKVKEETDNSEDENIKSEANSQKDCDGNSTDESVHEEDDKVKEFLKEFDADTELQENSEDEISDESSEDSENESMNDSENDCDNDDINNKNKSIQKKQSKDTSEGKTVFIRNISFKNTEEDLKEIVQEYGETVYCLFCMDPLSGHFKGTAFVKYKEKESADKLIEESSKEPGIFLDGRRLDCTHALSREELSKKHDGSEKVKDKRNLRLLKCGLIAYGFKESEGVSQTDMAKRAQLEMVKKQKLKNVNFFVSDKRLACHNLPKNINDKDLQALFKKAAGEGTVITEARVMKDLKKTDAQGYPISRGFGFVAFTEHEHALKALKELNNNPNVFTASKRPIVEFSVENKVALLSQERRKEKWKMWNKKKSEQNNNKLSQTNDEQQSSKITFQKIKSEWNKSKFNQTNDGQQFSKTNSQKKNKQTFQKKKKQIDMNSDSPSRTVSQKKQIKKETTEKKRKQIDMNGDLPSETVSEKKQKKQKGKKNRKSQFPKKNEDISMLTKKYKEKLLNKFS